jgi:hypothetical protein
MSSLVSKLCLKSVKGRRRWENNIKIILKELRWDTVGKVNFLKTETGQ